MSDVTNPIVIKPQLPLTPDQIHAQVQLIQSVMEKVMLANVHYGKIPGTSKPTLLKAGAEKLLSTFRISVDPEIEDLSGPDFFRYRVKTRGVHMLSNTLVGVGVGECSTNEEKYRWEGVICPEQWEETATDQRRVKFMKKDGGILKIQQIRTNHHDKANTVLKMAKKRSIVDLALSATAASDIFEQDLDEENVTGKPPTQSPRPKSGGSSAKATEAQVKMLNAKLNATGLREADLLAHMNVSMLEQIAKSQVDRAVTWIENNAP